MPSTLLILALSLVRLLSVHGENRKIGIDNELLSYYTPNSEKNGQVLLDGRYALEDSSKPVKSGMNSARDFEWREALLRGGDLFSDSLPPSLSLSSGSSLLGAYDTRLKTQDPTEDDFQDGQRDYGTDVGIYQGSRANFYPFDKRAGVENRFTVFRPTLRDHYLSLLEDKPWAVKEFKRQRISGGTTLSVDSSMDVIRQRLLNGLRRNQLLQKQRQIEHNEKLLTSIGKRQVSSQVSKDDVSQSESQ